MSLFKKTILIILSFFISIIYYYFIQNLESKDINSYKDKIFKKNVYDSKNHLERLIKEKQNATRSIILSISKDNTLIEDMENKKDIRLNLKEISNNLRINTNFKNLWFQIIDKEGNSLKRTWTDKKGDNLIEKRMDIKLLLKNPKIYDNISVGIFDLNMKSIVPIYSANHNFLGFIEIISHFNSISTQLAKNNIKLISLVNKKYTKKLKYPFSKEFIQGHYISNMNVDSLLLLKLKKYKIDNIIEELNNKKYIFIKELNLLVSSKNIISTNNHSVGSYLLFKDITDIKFPKINDIKNNYNLYIIIGIMLIIFSSYLIIRIDKNKDTRKNNIKLILFLSTIYAILFVIIYFILNNIYTSNIENYINNKKNGSIYEYKDIYNQNHNIANLIFEFIINDKTTLKLFKERKRDELIKLLEKRYTYIKNEFNIRQLHFHLPDSTSFLRMHKLSKYGDSLKGIRESVDYVNKYLKSFDGFEEGRIVNGFRFVYPLFKDNIHIGSVEISFSGLSFLKKYINSFPHKDIELLISKNIINKKIFNSEKNHYIPSFIDGFYFEKDIITLKDDKSFNNNITRYYKNTKNKIFKGDPFTEYIPELHKLNIYIPLINKISHKVVGAIYIAEDDDYLKTKYINFLVYFIFIVVTLLILIIFIYKEIISKNNIRISKNMTQTILDSQPNLILLINKNKIINANKTFLEFFNIKKIEEFYDNYNNIYDLFLDTNILSKIGIIDNNIIWINYLIKNPILDNIFKIINPKTTKEHIFKLDIQTHINDNSLFIISLIDITDIKNMERQILESEKMASMGEMIGNIAHQWRQPLSIISTSATGMSMKKEFNMLTDDEFYKYCEHINLNAQYLSKTIDDFRDYIKGDKKSVEFNLKDNISSFLTLLEGSIKNNNISIVLDLKDNIILKGYPKELIQCFINILNNAKDAFNEKNIEKRYFFITNKIKDNNIVIKLKDNAGGIPTNIISKIFEPYFTTKHKSIGTGIGLHMTYNIITNSMHGVIEVNNVKYIYKKQEQNGAEFKIIIPIS